MFMCVKVTFSNNCCAVLILVFWSVVLIVSLIKVYDCFFVSKFSRYIGRYAVPECVWTATQIVNIHSSGYQGIQNGKYDLFMIDV